MELLGVVEGKRRRGRAARVWVDDTMELLGVVEGKRRWGRAARVWVDIMELLGCTLAAAVQAAQDRTR